MRGNDDDRVGRRHSEVARHRCRIRYTIAMTASDAALRAVAANAARHLSEANQHLEAGRFPSATASAILAAEELGKFVLHISSGSILPLPKKLHAANARLIVTHLHVFEGAGWVAAWGRLRDEDLPIEALDPKHVQRMKEHPEYSDFLRRVAGGELVGPEERRNAWNAATAAKMTREVSGWATGNVSISASTRVLLTEGLQRLRLKATYVDVDSAGDALSDPGSLSEDVPRGLCLAVTELFSAICKMVSMQRPSLSLSDIENSLRADPGSVDVYTRSRLLGAVIDAATD